MAGAVTVPTVSAATIPAGTSLSAGQIAGIRKSAQDFEAMVVGELLQPMFKTVDTSKGPFGGGQGEATWQPLMVQEMAKSIAKNGGLGIADAAFREMLRMQEKAHD
jgi:Rod binding domain-containing protein